MKKQDEIDASKIPTETEFYYGGENCTFFLMCSQFCLNKDNENLIGFFSLDIGSQIFQENTYRNGKYFLG